MEVIIFIGIAMVLFWLYDINSSPSSNYSNTPINKSKINTPIIHQKITSKSSSPSQTISVTPSRSISPSQTISVTPSKISSSPELKISLIDGQYRYFENHYVNGKQYSFGFPKDNCYDKRVWVGIGSNEIERISRSEAIKRNGNNEYITNKTKYIDSSSSRVGYCSSCNKKLQGNIYKEKCYECYTNKMPQVQKVGYCSNCNKKLRGNIFKKHCTECYYNGFR